ncbi:S49 family peptidase [bacterium]|nr:S49 family peptidase [bacterium]
MLSFVRTFFAVIAAILFLFSLPTILLISVALFADSGPQDGAWLTVRLDGSLLEYYGPATLSDLVENPPPCLMEITENLEKAATDDRIAGVVFRLDSFAAGLGKLDEIRDGIRGVRAAGKPVYAFAQELTDAGVYLSSECDSTFLFPDGTVYLLGRGATIEHVRGTLDKLDVHPQFHAIDEYKSAVELFTLEHSSAEAIANLTWLSEDLQGAYDEVVEGNCALEPGSLVAGRRRTIFRAEDARDAGLVDALLTWEELADRLAPPHDPWRTISSPEYANVSRSSVDLGGGTRIAVVHAQGFVASSGEDRYDPVVGLAMGVDRVIDDLETARGDRRVKAVLLRLDTPGGATDGAQRVARAVARVRAEKPVIVSVADVAASGGYMMSAPADRIVCPGSGITGSIGSITGKFNLRGLYEKFGVTFDDVSFAPNAFLFSELHDWTDVQWEKIMEAHWDLYHDWIEDIARVRGLAPDDVHESARGQVWTGRQALDRNLVDTLGGFREAVEEVRRQVDLEEGAPVTFDHYPREESLLDVVLSGDLSRFAVNDVLRAAWSAVRAAGTGPRSLAWEPRRFD